MQLVTFNRIEDRELGLVVVFDEGFSRQFCLNRENLELRIRNIKAGLAGPDRDASVEMAALAELNRRTTVPARTTSDILTPPSEK